MAVNNPIWKYFIRTDKQNLATCLYCGKNIAFTKGSSSNLRRHLGNKHPTYMQVVNDTQNIADGQGKANKSIELPSTSQTQIISEVRPSVDAFSRSSVGPSILMNRSQVISEVQETSNAPIDGPSKTSPIWSHFSRSGNGVTAKCHHCQRDIVYSRGSTSNLKRHLVKIHPSIFVDCKQVTSIRDETNESVQATVRKIPLRPSSIWEHYTRTEKKNVANCKHCRRNIKYSGTSNLKRHLQIKHLKAIMYMKRMFAARDALTEVDDRQASSSTTASIWKHFTSIDNGISAECVYCSSKIAMTNGSSSSLEMHLVQEHPNIEMVTEQLSSPPSSTLDETSYKPAPTSFEPALSHTTLRNDTEEYNLKSHSHPQDINASLANLYRNDRYADVMLLTCNGEENYTIPAHKFILGSASLYFANIFDKSIVPSNAMTYIVLPPDITYRSMEVLLQYMYTGESTISNDILNEVLRGGEILKIRGFCANERAQISRTGGYTGGSGINKQNSQNIHPRQNNQIQHAMEKTKTPPCTIQEHRSTAEEFNLMDVKMENVEWNDYDAGDLGPTDNEVLPMGANSRELVISEATIKLEDCTAEDSRSPLPSTDQPTFQGSLACELCSERFTTPSELVRHIKVHSEMVQYHPSKRPRQEGTSNDETAPLKCGLCSTFYATPAEWILHLQNTHTETELAVSSNRTLSPKTRPSLSREDRTGQEAS
ncbi:uncharacterized protein LOC131294235 [Anopheles ziemanni]|uniref:uncharacterized protein LOC131267465 n=1 Tax=Anopheles coustani TaxID=139045 RepID=UPI002658E5B7|nr:uncharacterized protein LOC131267465 [Anopheles coustani]XP_058178263.1 uncharacterized protein LOC131294235 [Anopheles ziemanni]